MQLIINVCSQLKKDYVAQIVDCSIINKLIKKRIYLMPQMRRLFLNKQSKQTKRHLGKKI